MPLGMLAVFALRGVWGGRGGVMYTMRGGVVFLTAVSWPSTIAGRAEWNMQLEMA